MLKKTASFFDFLMKRYTPDPFLLALLITALIFILGLLLTPTSPSQMTLYWGNSFWKLTVFTMQMAMVLIGGYVVASAPVIDGFLVKLASRFTTPTQAICATTALSLMGSWLNWGFGLVIGAMLCRKIRDAMPDVNFRLLVAVSYSGFLVWHGGLSGSIPLLLATPGNFSEALIGHLIPTDQTIFSPLNLSATLGVSLALLVLNYYLGRTEGKVTPEDRHHINASHGTSKHVDAPANDHYLMPAEKLENSRLVTLLTCVLGVGFIGGLIFQKKFALDLNTVNFIFLFLGFALHGTPKRFITAILEGAQKVGPILLQFPFYAGIMGMMTDSGLATLISQFFIDISTKETFSLLTFYSAGLINLFVPSGGGQWALQAPIVIPAAKTLGVDLARASMAIAWGDAWTNMLQPFWALPVLSIAGLHLRDIMGYCVLFLLVSGGVLSFLFLG